MKYLGLLVMLAAAPAWAGGSASLCAVPASFAGDVIVGSFAPGTVALEWTAQEDGTTRQYRLSRRAVACGSAHGCSTQLGRVRAQAAGMHTYGFVDTAPAGVWVYQIEARRTGGETCVRETTVVVPAFPVCDTGALCTQVESSFAGDVIIGGIVGGNEIEWLTHAESGGSYRLSRSNCRNPRTCMTEIATVDATGTCGTVVLHRLTDEVPAGDWIYHLEVLDATERTACAFDLRLPGPASPASSH